VVLVAAPERAAHDGAGSYQATSLSPSATWDVSAQIGDFSTGYPLRMPPAPGAPVPNLALSYRSSAADGRTSVRNSSRQNRLRRRRLRQLHESMKPNTEGAVR
jgi:hypothetical protein